MSARWGYVATHVDYEGRTRSTNPRVYETAKAAREGDFKWFSRRIELGIAEWHDVYGNGQMFTLWDRDLGPIHAVGRVSRTRVRS